MPAFKVTVGEDSIEFVPAARDYVEFERKYGLPAAVILVDGARAEHRFFLVWSGWKRLTARSEDFEAFLDLDPSFEIVGDEEVPPTKSGSRRRSTSRGSPSKAA